MPARLETAACQPLAVDSAATAYFPSLSSGFDGFVVAITFLPQPKNNSDHYHCSGVVPKIVVCALLVLRGQIACV